MLQQFMKERNRSNVTFVTLNLHQNGVWRHMLGFAINECEFMFQPDVVTINNLKKKKEEKENAKKKHVLLFFFTITNKRSLC